MQPDEINQLRLVLQEYLTRKQNILNEIDTLKGDLKTLDEEFADKLDIKHIKLAEKHFNVQANVTHKDTFDLFVEAMGDPTL
jgi:hypothetical protein